ncbi:MAG: glycosyltransferase family 4 protein [Phaeodactylibacter sp.]|nr:glycosyltransferase family 4 protein [Phaeodactylibacter sp.]
MATKGRIIHISTPRSWRGGEQQLAYLVEELQDSPFEQLVFCNSKGAVTQRCQAAGWNHLTFSRKTALPVAAARQLARICKSGPPTLLHVHDSHAHTLAVLSASLFGNSCPIIVSRRVDFPVKKSPLSRWKYNHASVAKILCVSDMIRRITAPAIKDQDKLAVVYSGVDTNRFPYPASGILRREFQIPDHFHLIGNVAAIAPHKDYFTFVDTAALLLQKQQNLHFLIIGGDGGEQAAIEAYIRSKKLEAHITLTGFRRDIPKVLPEIDILLFTSKTEGLGTSLIDAFLCEVPVVATNTGGIPELVIHEKTGLLAPAQAPEKLALEVRRLLADPDLAAELCSHALEKAQAFSKQKTAQQTLYWYRQLFG